MFFPYFYSFIRQEKELSFPDLPFSMPHPKKAAYGMFIYPPPTFPMLGNDGFKLEPPGGSFFRLDG
jgi:hypothetical protein